VSAGKINELETLFPKRKTFQKKHYYLRELFENYALSEAKRNRKFTPMRVIHECYNQRFNLEFKQ
jgi:hypothetical protein